MNRPLFDYYKKLIKIRREHPAFTRTPIKKIRFIEADKFENGETPQAALGYIYDKQDSGDNGSYLVLINGNKDKITTFSLPEGKWNVLLGEVSNEVKDYKLTGKVSVQGMDGLILYQ